MSLIHLDTRLPWLLPTVLVLAAGLILGTAWISELYGAHFALFNNQNLTPCQLCLVQRYPYALILVLGAAAILLSHQAMERTLLLSVIGLALVFGAYVSGFHIGVEYGWWTAGSTCTSALDPVEFEETIVLSAATAPPPSCSDAAWRFPAKNGLSMAGYNFLLSSAMAIGTFIFALASLRRVPREDY